MRPVHSRFRLRREKGFTLIEMLVVIAIIAILMAAIVAVGSMVRTNVLRRHTLAELKLLDGVMKDYLADGNPEPAAPLTGTSWPYTIGDSGGEYAQTKPPSDLTNWVAVLESNPKYARMLATLPMSSDGGGVSSTGVQKPVIQDAFGIPIRYVRSDAAGNIRGQDYFMSAGPDANFSMYVNRSGQAPSPPPRADEIYSYDAQ